ncbi:uncharacterized protein TNCT_546371 [Trichonephila clavata]|uniref:Uncharacterized protein n=1 Tax=Trichonephila clavata TaxID=2740835 RepID=A0A8X6KSV4_TRICU|nr:uncharacterized protein TNCT_546371 [Trichonephila clavata]
MDAFRIIQSIAISDSNYLTAWELLEDHYSNKREQVFAHIRRLMSLNTIQCESASAVLSLVDNVNEIIRALEILDKKIDDFSDTLILYVILQKLDSSTKLWWERQIKKDMKYLN